jgi:A118 family predicted phage portal protein
VTVSFDDSVVEDKNAEIDQQIKLVSSGLNSKKRAIMKIHGVTEEEAMQILQEIQQENLQASPDLEELQSEVSFFGQRE